MAVRRAIGIVRVSQVAGREGESFASPSEQRARIEAACERDKLRLLAVHEELDVSGGAELEHRPGLSKAVALIESGDAEVLVAAYFDRFFRSTRVQSQVVERVERAGGQVLAVDIGTVSHASAGMWLSSTLLGAVSEYQQRSSGERSREAVIRSVARGVLPYSNVPPGLRKRKDGILEPDGNAPIARQAFELRAGGATIREVRAFLAANGIQRSYHGVQHMLCSRLYLGEIHFGKLSNVAAHEAVVPVDVWQRAQQAHVSRGRRAKSERLLARLGVLRCGTCGSRMVVGSSHHGQYPIYRCPPTGDCQQRMAVSALLVEGVVEEEVREAIADEEGRASVETDAQEAVRDAEGAQAVLDAAVRAFTGLEDETAARERLTALREARDAKRERADQLSGQRAALTISGLEWDRLSIDGRRALVRAVVRRVTIGPGRGVERVGLELFSE